jgi:hypothetical protein
MGLCCEERLLPVPLSFQAQGAKHSAVISTKYHPSAALGSAGSNGFDFPRLATEGLPTLADIVPRPIGCSIEYHSARSTQAFPRERGSNSPRDCGRSVGRLVFPFQLVGHAGCVKLEDKLGDMTTVLASSDMSILRAS